MDSKPVQNGPVSQQSHLDHNHTFGQDVKLAAESRTGWVIVLTASMMIVEIIGGIVYGSMALLADGLHMGSHAVALAVSYFAYIYARRQANNPAFTFGTGKVNALAGYSGAILLLIFALTMGYQSVERLINPVPIHYNHAIFVAVIGLLVNGLSIWLLEGGSHSHGHTHSHDHSQIHSHSHDHSHHNQGEAHHDHNLRSAYLHVLADALTSLLAIFALLAAKYFGLNWMDPLMGLAGMLLVTRWSISLIQQSGSVLLDRDVNPQLSKAMRTAIEAHDGQQVSDLHIWQIAPGHYAAIIAVVSRQPMKLAEYREIIMHNAPVSHLSIEIESLQEE